LKLFYYGHEMVSQPRYPLVERLEEIRDLRDHMVEMMVRHGYKGLAAPQIGIWLQLIVVKLENGLYLDLVNPVIRKMYGSETEQVETCVSCPPKDNGCKVPRMQIIEVTASSVLHMEDSDYRFKGYDARVIQHEVDHLEGTFFFHRASNKDRIEVIQRFKNWRHQRRLELQGASHGNDSSSSTAGENGKTNGSPA
jgi:peptide deformylase